MTILNERRLTLTQAARKLGVNPSTTWRWSLHGVRGVKLETFSVGVQRFTTEESLERFVEGTTAAAAGGHMPSVRTSRQRERAIDRAEGELERAGI